MGGTRRLPNLSEILSPTLQQPSGGGGGPGENGNGDIGAAGERWNSSYHLNLYKTKGRFDVCSHMVETSTIRCPYFGRKFAIHERKLQDCNIAAIAISTDLYLKLV